MKLRTIWSLLLCFVTFGLAGCEGTPPPDLGVTAGRLAPCPDSPNCVSSQADDEEHGMEPIEYDGATEAARDRLLAILAARARTEVVESEPNYIRAEARSRIFGFVDDVEFYLDEEAGLIHFRSASRMGYSDMGVNRDRMVEISAEFYRRAAETPAASS